MEKGKRILNLLLIPLLALAFPISSGAQEVLDVSHIDPFALPTYMNGERLETAGLTERLTKYDNDEYLNIVGFETENGNEVINIFPYNVKYVEHNQLLDKNVALKTVESSSLVRKGYTRTNTANNIELYFPEDIAQAGGWMRRGGCSLKLRPVVRNNTVAIQQGETAVLYADALGNGSDFVLKSNYSGMDLSITSENIDQQTSFSFLLETDDYELQLEENDVLAVIDKNTKQVAFTMAPLQAEDIQNSIAICDMTLVQTDSTKYTLTATLSQEQVNVLTTNDVVTLSASMVETTTSLIEDAPVYSNFSVNMGSFKYGVVGTNSSYGAGRLYVKFNISALTAAGISYDRVLSAYYHVPFNSTTNVTYNSKMEAYLVKESWSESTVTWANKPNYLNEALCIVNSDWDKSLVDDETDKSEFYITAAVQAWLQGVTNNGIVIKERDDSGYVSYATRENTTNTSYLSVLVTSETAPNEGSGVAEGTYYIKGKINNMYMTLSGSSVVQKGLQASLADQLWTLDYLGSGVYTISPVSAPTKYLKATTNITASTGLASTGKWKVRRNWDGSYSILSQSSNYAKCVSVGVNYYTEGYSLIHDTDSMGLAKYDDWTLIPNEKGTASVFGFTKSITTSVNANKTKTYLQSLGYSSTAYINQNATFALNKMSSSGIFTFYGHGEAGCIQFHDLSKYTYLTGSPTANFTGAYTIESLNSNALKNQMLTIYSSCLTGRTMPATSSDNDANSLVGMTYFRGSHYVVSFTNETLNDSTGYFTEYFYTALIDGATVYQALHDLNNHIADYKNTNNLTEIPDQYYEPVLYRYCLGDNSLVYHLPQYTAS